MTEENNKNKQKEKADSCPLCQVSEETIERLKKEAGKKEKNKKDK